MNVIDQSGKTGFKTLLEFLFKDVFSIDATIVDMIIRFRLKCRGVFHLSLNYYT